MAEAERRQFGHLPVPVGQLVAHQVGAGDAEMDAPCRQLARDLAGREQHECRSRRAPSTAPGVFARRRRTAAWSRRARRTSRSVFSISRPLDGTPIFRVMPAPPQFRHEAGADDAADRRDRAALPQHARSAHRSARPRRRAAGPGRRRGRKRRSRRSIPACCGRGWPRRSAPSGRRRGRRARRAGRPSGRPPGRWRACRAARVAQVGKGRGRGRGQGQEVVAAGATSRREIGGVAASSSSAAARAAISAALRSPMNWRVGDQRLARASSREQARRGLAARACGPRSGRAARGSGAGRQIWRKSAALRRSSVSSPRTAAIRIADVAGRGAQVRGGREGRRRARRPRHRPGSGSSRAKTS